MGLRDYSLKGNLPILLSLILTGISDMLPDIISEITKVIMWICESLVYNLPELIEASITLFTGIVQAIPAILPVLRDNLPEIITTIIYGLVDSLPMLLNSCGELIITVMDTIFNLLPEIFSDLYAIIITLISGMFDKLPEVIPEIINSIVEIINKIGNKIWSLLSYFPSKLLKWINSVINSVKNVVISVFNSIKTVISTPLNEAKNTVSNIFSGIKKTISDSIDGAKNTVQKGLNLIKGFFDKLKIKFPDIKLPHFSIKGSFSLSPPSVPKLSVDWYAKAMNNAMLLNEPTIFGVNPNGNLLGGGEAGQEVVAGSGTLMGMIKSAVKSENTVVVIYLEKLIAMLATYFPEILANLEKEIILDDRTLVGKLAPAIDSELGGINKMRERGK